MIKKLIITFLISMVPLIELRGAVPVAVGMGVPLWAAYIVAVIGNMLPVPFIFLFARKFLEWGKDKKLIGKFCKWVLRKGEKGGKKLTEKTKNDNKAFLIFSMHHGWRNARRCNYGTCQYGCLWCAGQTF